MRAPGFQDQVSSATRSRLTTKDHDVTRYLLDWSRGDERACEQLLPLVYDELRRQAGRYLRKERVGHTLQPTALANEAYLRLVDQQQVQWRNRAHFFAIAAQMMRRILVDHARRSSYAKRGGGVTPLPLDEAIFISAERAPDLVALDDCLVELEKAQPEAARVVELKYFGGLSNEEIREVLKISIPTVTRRWRMARAWLYTQLSNLDDSHAGG